VASAHHSIPSIPSISPASAHRYAIDRKIASGGMATVFLGRQLGALGLDRRVAIKVCHPHLLESEHRKDALLDEARIASRVQHPSVVSTLDVVEHDGSIMIVMEYVEGLTVAGLVRAAGRAGTPIPVGIALRVLEHALAGLHAAHEQAGEDGEPLGIVHRDVSPQNVLVGIDGFAKLADFGVSKGASRLAPSTETGELKGKLGYVAPEVYRGEPVTRQADVYGAAVVLWEMLAGRRLFDQPTHAAMMQRVLGGRVPALASERADVPPELDAVLARALAVDTCERFPTAEAMSEALARLGSLPRATARELGAHVRDAMGVEPSGTPQVGLDPFAHEPLARQPLAHELTPSEYVTPVRVAGRRRTAASGLAAGALALVAVVGIAYLRPSTRGASHGTAAEATTTRGPAASATVTSALEASAPPTSATVTSATVTSAPEASATPAIARGSRAVSRGSLPPSVSSVRARPSRPSSTSAPPTSAVAAPPPTARPFYDPEEL